MTMVSARDLVVEFPIYGAKSRSFKNTVMHAATGGVLGRGRRRSGSGTRADRVTFDFQEGERVGLVGHNGSGKTTLLRAIAGVYEPTGGSMERAAASLDARYYPRMDVEATGWDNIFLRGTILGLRRREIWHWWMTSASSRNSATTYTCRCAPIRAA